MSLVIILLGLAIFIALINISFYLRKLNENAVEIKQLLAMKR